MATRYERGTVLKERYEIISFLAKGGMGKTYLAADGKTKKKVVLKLLAISELEDWKVLELFEREIKTLAAIDHPLIPDYIDNFKIEEGNEITHVLVQEYVEGGNFLDLIRGGKRFTESEIKTFLESLLKTISYIHSLNPPVIHRDINPKNIVLSKDGRVYLVDFGAVADVGKRESGSTVVGTIGYMPPEQLYGKVTRAADMYALGATIVFILTGKEPSEFELRNMRPDYHDDITISRPLMYLLDSMLDPDHTRRLSDAGKALAVLEGKEPRKRFETGTGVAGTERVIIKKNILGDTEITVKTPKLMYVFLIFFALAWNSFLFGFLGNFGEVGDIPFFMLIFMLPFFAVGIGLIVFVFYGIFGRSMLTLSASDLLYTDRIFGFTLKKKAIPICEFRDMKITEERGNRGTISHVLTIYGAGKTIRIGKMMNLERGDLEYLKDYIESNIPQPHPL
ncbi:MAG: serine/threonine protein kinase [Spirochaetales bacterium]|nr:serine/threonine protein kinase [Spirochaetales bacterium]